MDIVMDPAEETCIRRLCQGPNRLLVRYHYIAIFLLFTVIAWMVGYVVQSLFEDMHYMRGCTGDISCLGTEGVLRITFGSFMFFSIMFLSTVGISSTDDPRDLWHRGFWPVKIAILIACVVVPFFLPIPVTKFYGELSRFGSGVFLFVQFLAILNVIIWWNEVHLSQTQKDSLSRLLISFSSLACFAVSSVGVVMMYIYFSPHTSCEMNIFLITWTIVQILVTICISLHPKTNMGILSSGFMSLYLAFLCWYALSSEPVSNSCNLQPQSSKGSIWLTIVSFMLGAFTLSMATFSVRIDPYTFSAAIKEKDADTCVPYSYGFFHFTFALASMYVTMLLMSWNLNQGTERWPLDFSWANVWIKITNQWLATGLYICTVMRLWIMQH